MIGDFNEDRNYMLGVGNEFPDIFLQGVDENNSIVEISNMSVPEGDNWQVIFFYPKDFTFICPTEIAKMDKLIDDKVNVWNVIDTYFRDEPYYKSQHQIDSYDEFIYSSLPFSAKFF